MRKIGRPTIEPLTMTAEYEASIRKASERAGSAGQVQNTESLPGQRMALLDEIDALRDILETQRLAIAAADEMRGFFGSMDARYPSRTTAAVLGYDAARAALVGAAVVGQ